MAVKSNTHRPFIFFQQNTLITATILAAFVYNVKLFPAGQNLLNWRILSCTVTALITIGINPRQSGYQCLLSSLI